MAKKYTKQATGRHMRRKMPSRVARRPAINFNLKTRAFGIYPFCAMPVLPDETLRDMSLQVRKITDPVKNPITGWWTEYYFFYVTLEQLDIYQGLTAGTGRGEYVSWVLNRNGVTLPVYTARKDICDAESASGDAANFVDMAYRLCVDKYFRKEDETATVPNTLANADGAFLAPYATMAGVSDSTMLYPNDSPDGEATDAVDGDGDINLEILSTSQEAWEELYRQKLVNMTYDELLASYGLSAKTKDVETPELLYACKQWQYPTNHVFTQDPDAGGALVVGQSTSAVSWAIRKKMHSRKLFKKHGFIIGLTVTRPKTYQYEQLQSSMAIMAHNSLAWLPPFHTNSALGDDGALSSVVRNVAAENNPFTAASLDTFDVRDFLIRGDSFLNFRDETLEAGYGRNIVASEAQSEQLIRYPDEDTIEAALFTNASPLCKIREDGHVRFTILGTQTDQTG